MRTRSDKENKITRIRYCLTRITDVHTFFVLFAWIRPQGLSSGQIEIKLRENETIFRGDNLKTRIVAAVLFGVIIFKFLQHVPTATERVSEKHYY